MKINKKLLTTDILIGLLLIFIELSIYRYSQVAEYFQIVVLLLTPFLYRKAYYLDDEDRVEFYMMACILTYIYITLMGVYEGLLITFIFGGIWIVREKLRKENSYFLLVNLILLYLAFFILRIIYFIFIANIYIKSWGLFVLNIIVFSVFNALIAFFAIKKKPKSFKNKAKKGQKYL